MILQILVAFVGTVSFSVLFNVSRKHYLYCGLTGSVGWLFYLVVFQVSGLVISATFVASVALSILSRWLSVWRKTPTTVFLLCGIFTLVPGAGIYYTAYHLFMNNNVIALMKGGEAIKTALAIALGIAVVYSLPAKLFGWSGSISQGDMMNKKGLASQEKCKPEKRGIFSEL